MFHTTGATGHGLKLVLDVADQIELTNGNRGLKAVIYNHAEIHYLEQEGITFIQLGGFSTDVASKIERSLRGRSGDVILVFGPEPPATSARRRAAYEVATKDNVRRFAIVAKPEQLQFLSDLRHRTGVFSDLSKFVGCFGSPEDAIEALRPRSPQNDAPVVKGRPAAPTQKTLSSPRRRKEHEQR